MASKASLPPVDSPAQGAARRPLGLRILGSLGPILGLLVVVLFFTVLLKTRNDINFLDPYNLKTILSDTTIVAIAALGMTLVIIGGGIDLSTGSLVALSSVMCAKALAALVPATGEMTPLAWLGGFGAGIAIGALCGTINGLAVVGLRVVPFIATLGMLSAARGIAKWQADNIPIDVTYGFGDWVQPVVEPAWLIFAPSVWLTLLLAAVAAIVLRRSVYGRHVVALGSSEATARLCGLRIAWLKLSLYVIAGAMAGLAGVVQTARLTRGDPSVATGLELNVIAAVVIGGGSLMGGEGSILGTLAGALIMAVLANGATQAGWENYVQEILVGLIIVLAVALDQWRARRSSVQA